MKLVICKSKTRHGTVCNYQKVTGMSYQISHIKKHKSFLLDGQTFKSQDSVVCSFWKETHVDLNPHGPFKVGPT